MAEYQKDYYFREELKAHYEDLTAEQREEVLWKALDFLVNNLGESKENAIFNAMGYTNSGHSVFTKTTKE